MTAVSLVLLPGLLVLAVLLAVYAAALGSFFWLLRDQPITNKDPR